MNRNYVLTELSIGYNRSSQNPRLNSLIAVATEARNYFYRHTLPWDTDGVHLLHVSLFDSFNETMQVYAEDFHKMAFEIASSMASMKTRYMPYPYVNFPYDNKDIRVKLVQDEGHRLFAAQCGLVHRINETITMMEERLAIKVMDGVPKPKKFHDTLFSTILDDCRIFHLLNIEEDDDIADTIYGLSEVASNDPKEVRSNLSLRQSLLEELKNLHNLLSNA